MERSKDRTALYVLGALMALVLLLVGWNQLRAASDRAAFDRDIQEARERLSQPKPRSAWERLFEERNRSYKTR